MNWFTHPQVRRAEIRLLRLGLSSDWLERVKVTAHVLQGKGVCWRVGFKGPVAFSPDNRDVLIAECRFTKPDARIIAAKEEA